MFFLPNTHFAVTTTIGLAIGAALALLFCGMSCIFMKIERKKSGGKDNSKIANGENTKKLPKTGITDHKPKYWVPQFILSFTRISYKIYYL